MNTDFISFSDIKGIVSVHERSGINYGVSYDWLCGFSISPRFNANFPPLELPNSIANISESTSLKYQ
jgi:hypothetical protein